MRSDEDALKSLLVKDEAGVVAGLLQYGKMKTMCSILARLAPGAISDDEKKALEDLVTSVNDSAAWAEILETNGWTDAFLVGDEFSTFLEGDISTTKETLKTIGLIE